ncbi:MAG: AAA family ATPase [Actinobacteria bacterium]|jgi:recombinational DNA repair ATPase RecF|nr:AAA family ATPase [Actinomycetota bacterium]MCL6093228.1 AAA family ATPase [Actinomycetota bacterium]
MNNNNKTNAKEYLREYQAKQGVPAWLGLLIGKANDNNGSLSEDEKNEIFSDLLKENGLKTEGRASNEEDVLFVEPQPSVAESPDTITLEKIKHVKGVNALIPGQSIQFSSACTIIYGMNGTGKSGYFRIIHELAGGEQTKSILDNIHQDTDGLEVEIEYSSDGKKKDCFKWQDKSRRGIQPFDLIRVFDSEYLPIFLNERESSVNVEPLGLNLFRVIASIVDEYKVKLQELVKQTEQLEPDLSFLIDALHSDSLRGVFQKKVLSEADKKIVESNIKFKDDKTTKLAELRQQRQNLEKNNTEDTKKVLRQEKGEIDDLKNHLDELAKTLPLLSKDTEETISNYLEKKRVRDGRATQFEVLKSIPGKDSEEWQNFIESAEEYIDIMDQSVLDKDKNCIYCHQPLNEEAGKLVRAYSEYLSDQSQAEFKEAMEEIEALQSRIDDIDIEISLSEEIKATLNDTGKDAGEALTVSVNNVITVAKSKKTELLAALKQKKVISEDFVLDLLSLDQKLTELSTQKKIAIDDLAKTGEEKAKKIAEIESAINDLEDNEIIAKSKSKIESYFECCKTADGINKINKTISTRAITELGGKAHDELLTDSIRKAFEDELKVLGNDVGVSLNKARAGKGSVKTRLTISGKDVCDILSDGEQKAVGLALFLAEIESQDDDSPVVFDDPVTSLDHRVADSLAKRLIQMSATKQIIIFTHNKLFYDSLVYWSNKLKDAQNNKTHHICKNYTQKGCNGSGCHVITYTVDREAKDRTGKIFEAQNESCAYFIEQAEFEIKGQYTKSTVAQYLKSAIEHYIDEKVLLGTGLLKDRRQGAGIPWQSLKKIESKKEIIEKLEGFWADLSNRASHSTSASRLNPLSDEDFRNMIAFLKQ